MTFGSNRIVNIIHMVFNNCFRQIRIHIDAKLHDEPVDLLMKGWQHPFSTMITTVFFLNLYLKGTLLDERLFL